jgi:predicted transcriptional regulator
MKRSVAFALDPEDEARLTALAKATQRTKSHVIRLLIQQARVLPFRDVLPIEVRADQGIEVEATHDTR